MQIQIEDLIKTLSRLKGNFTRNPFDNLDKLPNLKAHMENFPERYDECHKKVMSAYHGAYIHAIEDVERGVADLLAKMDNPKK